MEKARTEEKMEESWQEEEEERWEMNERIYMEEYGSTGEQMQ